MTRRTTSSRPNHPTLFAAETLTGALPDELPVAPAGGGGNVVSLADVRKRRGVGQRVGARSVGRAGGTAVLGAAVVGRVRAARRTDLRRKALARSRQRRVLGGGALGGGALGGAWSVGPAAGASGRTPADAPGNEAPVA